MKVLIIDRRAPVPLIMAEVLRQLLTKEGVKDVEIKTATTFKPPSLHRYFEKMESDSRHLLEEIGVPYGRGTGWVANTDFTVYDLVICGSDGIRHEVQISRPQILGVTHVATTEHGEINNPWFGTIADYELARKDAEFAMRRILQVIIAAKLPK